MELSAFGPQPFHGYRAPRNRPRTFFPLLRTVYQRFIQRLQLICIKLSNFLGRMTLRVLWGRFFMAFFAGKKVYFVFSLGAVVAALSTDWVGGAFSTVDSCGAWM